MTTFCLSCLDLFCLSPYASAVWCPSSLHEICWQSGEVSKSVLNLYWGPGSGGSLGGCVPVWFFFTNSSSCLASVDTPFTFFSYLWTTPKSHAIWRLSFSWSTSVNCVAKLHSTRASHLAREGVLSKLLLPTHHQGNRNSLDVKLLPWVQVEKANHW